MLDRLEEELVAVPLARALDGEDEVVAPPAQLDLALELGVAQALPADRVALGVAHHGLELAGVALVPAALLRGLLLGDLLQVDDALGEAVGELLGVGAQDGPRDVNGRHEAVRGGGDGRELGVVGADALVHVHGQVDGLVGAQLGDEDVRVDGGDGVVTAKVLDLVADGLKDYVARVDVGVVVGLVGVVLVGRGVPVDGAGDVEREADRVPVEAVGVGVLAVVGLLVPLEVVVQALTATLEGDEAQAVGEDLVLDDRRVVLDVDILNGEGGNLG